MPSPLDGKDGQCTFIAEQTDQNVRMAVEKKPGPGATCTVHWQPLLPSGADLDVKVGQGMVHINGHSSRLKADLGNGDLTLAGVTGDVGVRIGQGQLTGTAHPKTLVVALGQAGVHLDGLIRPAEVQAGIGNIELSWIVAPPGPDGRPRGVRNHRSHPASGHGCGGGHPRGRQETGRVGPGAGGWSAS